MAASVGMPVAIGFLQQFVTCSIDHDRPAGAKAVAKVFYGLRCDDAVIAGTDQQGRHLDPVKMLEPVTRSIALSISLIQPRLGGPSLSSGWLL
jgi:hypothetical protein